MVSLTVDVSIILVNDLEVERLSFAALVGEPETMSVVVLELPPITVMMRNRAVRRVKKAKKVAIIAHDEILSLICRFSLVLWSSCETRWDRRDLPAILSVGS